MNNSSKNEEKKLIIMGAGAFARETLWAINEIKDGFGSYAVPGFLDDDISKINTLVIPESNGIITRNLKILGSLDSLINSSFSDFDFILPAIGTTETKKMFTERILKYNCKLPGPIIHRSVQIGHDNIIGDGTIIFACVSITCNSNIGLQVTVNPNCSIAHDVQIENFCNLSPGVHLTGNVHLEEGVNIGTGAIVLPNIRIGKWSVIGAGAVVIEDIPPYSVAAGIPAKIIKKRS